MKPNHINNSDTEMRLNRFGMAAVSCYVKERYSKMFVCIDSLKKKNHSNGKSTHFLCTSNNIMYRQ